MLTIKRIGIGYYELEDGTIIDKGLYDLAVFLEKQRQKLLALLNKREEGQQNDS